MPIYLYTELSVSYLNTYIDYFDYMCVKFYGHCLTHSERNDYANMYDGCAFE